MIGRLVGIAKALVSVNLKEVCRGLEDLASPRPEGPDRWKNTKAVHRRFEMRDFGTFMPTTSDTVPCGFSLE